MTNTVRTKIGFEANERQFKAAVAANDARTAGKKEDEVFEAAKAAYDEAPAPAPVRSAEGPRDYLTAVCHLAQGDYDKLSNQQLFDCACLVRCPVHTADVWRELRQSLTKPEKS